MIEPRAHARVVHPGLERQRAGGRTRGRWSMNSRPLAGSAASQAIVALLLPRSWRNS